MLTGPPNCSWPFEISRAWIRTASFESGSSGQASGHGASMVRFVLETTYIVFVLRSITGVLVTPISGTRSPQQTSGDPVQTGGKIEARCPTESCAESGVPSERDQSGFVM